jgi:uncharacterized protein (TIGR03435 family)
MSGGPLPPGPFNMKGGDPARITWTNVRLVRVLMMAYDLPGDRISGPGWLDEETYDIGATMPRDATVADFKLMVEHLLAERFKMAVHRETKEVGGYWLEVAANGPKVKPSKSQPASMDPNASQGDPAIKVPPGTFVDKSGFPAPLPNNSMFPPGAVFAATIRVGDKFRAAALNMTMSEFAKYLTPAAGMPIVDHTGLTGLYDVHLEYKPRGTPPLDGGAADIDAPGPDLFDAVQSQLGLRLVRRKVPQEILVIDHAEKVPTEN